MILDWVPSHFPTDEHGARLLRRHAPLRARRSAPGLPPRLEELHLQLRPPRGAQLPALERALLARALPRRRAARRRGRVDALPRLLAQAPASGSRTRYGGRENLEAIDFLRRLQRGGLPRAPRRADHRRGVDRVADGVAPDRTSAGSASGSSGTWAGCTTRSRTCARDPVHRKLPPRRADLPRCSTRSARTSCCRSRTTRSCTGRGSLLGKMPGDDWQKFAQPAPAATATMYAQPGKKLLFMGAELGAVARVEPRGEPRLGPARARLAPRACSAGCAT